MTTQAQQVHLIRHGETAWSVSGQHTGITDIPLTQNGRKLARGLHPILSEEHFALVLTSPLQRARETCEAAGLGARAEIDRDLMEWNYGEYEGLTPEQIHAKSPGWMLFSDGCPGGESPEQIGARVDRVIARVRAVEGHVAPSLRTAMFSESLQLGGLDFRLRRVVTSARYGNAKHPELLWKHPGSEAVERHASWRSESAVFVSKHEEHPAQRSKRRVI